MNNQKLISNAKCWIESKALEQLESVSKLPGVLEAVGLPDLHPGKIPIGVAVKTQGILYPHLIGNDIGCGMSLFETNCSLRKWKPERVVTKLNTINTLADIPNAHFFNEESPIADLGTIGGGNHFAEFQKIDTIVDPAAFETLGIRKERLLVLIHSGSRGYGQRIFSNFNTYDGLVGGSQQAKDYMAQHDNALLWATRNRFLVAGKLMDYLGYLPDITRIIDCAHNCVEQQGDTYIHRKGAVRAVDTPVIIPGSRGSLTYIVQPTNETAYSAYSLSHGAGRKWARNLCKGLMKPKQTREALKHTKIGSHTVCHDPRLLYQEAPEAYKNIEHVIAALVEHKLCSIVATLRPIITFKG